MNWDPEIGMTKIKVKNSFTWKKPEKLFKLALVFGRNRIIICLYLVIVWKPRQWILTFSIKGFMYLKSKQQLSKCSPYALNYSFCQVNICKRNRRFPIYSSKLIVNKPKLISKHFTVVNICFNDMKKTIEKLCG